MASPCTQLTTYTNILDLPRTLNIDDGDFLIVETLDGTRILDFEDLIIPLQNTTFAGTLSSIQQSLESMSSIMNVRLSLSPSAATTTTSITSNTLYVHPYKGSYVTLYSTDTNTWQTYKFNNIISAPLADICNQADTCYDIYLSNTSGTFALTSRPWTNSSVGSVNFNISNETQYIDGIPVHPSDANKRLIGTIRTTLAGTTEVSRGTTSEVGGSHPKVFVWNQYNREPLNFSILEQGTTVSGVYTWSSTTGSPSANSQFGAFGGSNNRISFIVREPTNVIMNTQLFALSSVSSYLTCSLDNPAPSASELRQQTPGLLITQNSASGAVTHNFNHIIQPGNHFIQLVEVVSNSTTPQKYIVWGIDADRNSGGTTGIITGC
jgi:hypothetical protein